MKNSRLNDAIGLIMHADQLTLGLPDNTIHSLLGQAQELIVKEYFSQFTREDFLAWGIPESELPPKEAA